MTTHTVIEKKGKDLKEGDIYFDHNVGLWAKAVADCNIWRDNTKNDNVYLVRIPSSTIPTGKTAKEIYTKATKGKSQWGKPNADGVVNHIRE